MVVEGYFDDIELRERLNHGEAEKSLRGVV